MAGSGPRELGVAVAGEPRSRSVAVWQVARRVVGGQQLVDVMEEGRGLDEPPVDARARGCDARCQPACDLGNRACVAKEPGRWVEGEEELGGLDPPGNGQPLDGTAQMKANVMTGLAARANRFS